MNWISGAVENSADLEVLGRLWSEKSNFVTTPAISQPLLVWRVLHRILLFYTAQGIRSGITGSACWGSLTVFAILSTRQTKPILD